MTTPTEERPVIVRQEFPATVSIDGVQLAGPMKVFVTETTVYVYRGIDDVALTAVRTGPPTFRGMADPPSVPQRVPTTAGVVSWVKAKGCGCSHPLSKFMPFPRPRRI